MNGLEKKVMERSGSDDGSEILMGISCGEAFCSVVAALSLFADQTVIQAVEFFLCGDVWYPGVSCDLVSKPPP